MPNLVYTSSDFPFQPFTKIYSADVNQCFNDVKTLLNTTKLDHTNIQALGLIRYGATGNLQAGTANYAIYNDASGYLAEAAALPTAQGGTGLTSSGVNGNVLKSNGTTWVSSPNAAPTVTRFATTGTATGYVFTVSAANATVGAVYSNNGQNFTVLSTISSGALLFCSATGAPAASGNLSKVSGTGDATIPFTARVALGTYTAPAGVFYLRVQAQAAGAGGTGSGTTNPQGTVGGPTYFGSALIQCAGGALANTGTGAGGAGGAASIASPALTLHTVTGGSGGGQQAQTISTVSLSGGAGGGSFFGGAGGAGANSANGVGGTNGGGGSGGGTGAAANTFTGLGGGAGAYAESLITTPAATYFYAVGTGGSGGAAGTNGFSGGGGGDGTVVITEYYQ